MRPKSILAVLPLLLLLLGWPFIGEGRAASLEVTPVVVEFAAGQTATTIVVANHGGGPTAMQARAYHWAQAGDQDELTPAQDIIISPPIFTVAEGGLADHPGVVARQAGGPAARAPTVWCSTKCRRRLRQAGRSCSLCACRCRSL